MTADAAAPAGRARLFLALWPTPAVRNGLQAWRDAFVWPQSAAVVAAERLHLTLHFIGAVAREDLPTLVPALGVAAPRFEMCFGAPELWPGGIAVLRPLEVPAALLELHAALRDALQRLALPTEARPFRAHVTLARRAQGVTLARASAPVRWRVRGYALVESRPGRAGYEVLQRYP